jgi:predicted  nucleic acid-binding Zn-ribbon protein
MEVAGLRPGNYVGERRIRADTQVWDGRSWTVDTVDPQQWITFQAPSMVAPFVLGILAAIIAVAAVGMSGASLAYSHPVSHLQEQCNKMEQRRTQFEEKQQEMEEEQGELQDEQQQLSDRIDNMGCPDACATNVSVNHFMFEFSTFVDVMTANMSDVEKQLGDLIIQMGIMQLNFSSQMNSVQDDMSDVETRLDDLDARISGMQHNISSLDARLQSASQAIVDLSNQFSALLQAIVSANSSGSSICCAVLDYRVTILEQFRNDTLLRLLHDEIVLEFHEQWLIDLTHNVSQHERQLHDLNVTIHIIERNLLVSNTSLWLEIGALGDSLGNSIVELELSIDVQFNVWRSWNTTFFERLIYLEYVVANLLNSNNTLFGQTSFLRNAVDHLSDSVNGLLYWNSSLTSRILDLEDIVTHLLSTIDNYNTWNASFCIRMFELENVVTHLQNVVRSYDAWNASFCPRFFNLESIVSHLQDVIHNYDAWNATFCPRVFNLEDTVTHVLNTINAYNAWNASFCPRFFNLEDTVTHLQNVVAGITAWNASFCPRFFNVETLVKNLLDTNITVWLKLDLLLTAQTITQLNVNNLLAENQTVCQRLISLERYTTQYLIWNATAWDRFLIAESLAFQLNFTLYFNLPLLYSLNISFWDFRQIQIIANASLALRLSAVELQALTTFNRVLAQNLTANNWFNYTFNHLRDIENVVALRGPYYRNFITGCPAPFTLALTLSLSLFNCLCPTGVVCAIPA